MHDRAPCRRHAVTLHEALGEDFARFEPPARTIRAEHRNARIAQAVADAGRNRRLGPDHGQIDRARLGTARRSPCRTLKRISQFSPRDAVPAFPGRRERSPRTTATARAATRAHLRARRCRLPGCATPLLPLNRCRRFGRDIVRDAVYARHFVDDPRQRFVRADRAGDAPSRRSSRLRW